MSWGFPVDLLCSDPGSRLTCFTSLPIVRANGRRQCCSVHDISFGASCTATEVFRDEAQFQVEAIALGLFSLLICKANAVWIYA
jgi:hypothetical protein